MEDFSVKDHFLIKKVQKIDIRAVTEIRVPTNYKIKYLGPRKESWVWGISFNLNQNKIWIPAEIFKVSAFQLKMKILKWKRAKNEQIQIEILTLKIKTSISQKIDTKVALSHLSLAKTRSLTKTWRHPKRLRDHRNTVCGSNSWTTSTRFRPNRSQTGDPIIISKVRDKSQKMPKIKTLNSKSIKNQCRRCRFNKI